MLQAKKDTETIAFDCPKQKSEQPYPYGFMPSSRGFDLFPMAFSGRGCSSWLGQVLSSLGKEQAGWLGPESGGEWICTQPL